MGDNLNIFENARYFAMLIPLPGLAHSSRLDSFLSGMLAHTFSVLYPQTAASGTADVKQNATTWRPIKKQSRRETAHSFTVGNDK